jgi:ribonucleoside-diphosphate reductase alpha chain
MPALSPNALRVLHARYLLRDRRGVAETPDRMFERVAAAVAQAERSYPKGPGCQQARDRFFTMMRGLEFLPNSPTLMNAGTPRGQLSACFVLPLTDTIEGIFGTLADMARIHRGGGGTGFDFSPLRPRGDIVRSTGGTASGPVSFMSIFDRATEVIVQGGKRRGANMGVLRCDHPDIEEFIRAKAEGDALRNFNLSVGVTEAFVEAVRKGTAIPLVNPRTGGAGRAIDARGLFDRIVRAARETGEPGLLFLDRLERDNPTPRRGAIRAVNPCGESPLLPYESCNLGSINLARMVSDGAVDWDRLRECVRWAVRFLDDVIDVNRYPLRRMERVGRMNRKIGLGVMGFADLLIQVGIPYDSRKAVDLAEKIMSVIRAESLLTSASLAAERGSFPAYDESRYAPTCVRLRNATVNSIAPTGTISMIAGCSSGIEPLFAPCFTRTVLGGQLLSEMSPSLRQVLDRAGLLHNGFLEWLARCGSLRRLRQAPARLRRLLPFALDIAPEDHIMIQAAFQRFTDNGVSKTINLRADARVADVRRAYLMAHATGCKGITVYRYGCRCDQVLSLAGQPTG